MEVFGGFAVLGFALLGGIVGIVIEVLFLLNLRDLLREVRTQNRTMVPNYVWLNFIPIFNIYWIFVTVARIRDSARAEFRSRGWAPAGDFGYTVGLVYAITTLLSGIFAPMRIYGSSSGYTGAVAFGGLFSLVGLVSWILYWVRTAELKNRLRRGNGGDASVPGSPAAGSSVPGAGPGFGQGDLSGEDRTSAQSQPNCPQCGLLALPEDESCRSCGYDLGGLKRDPSSQDDTASSCPFCGATYRPDARFCAQCGRPVV